MKIRNDVLKCVAFAGYLRGDEKTYDLTGTVFLLSKVGHWTLWVTAKHVIDATRKLGVDHVLIRLNMQDGTPHFLRVPLERWFVHPTDASIDVAIAHLDHFKGSDHKGIPESWLVTPEVMERNEVALGDEVAIVGMFNRHAGSRLNIPIVRVGNLACISEEKVRGGVGFGDMDAYLVEARSLGGLSGSPVFLNLGPVRMLDGKLMHAVTNPTVPLLGLIHGHYDNRGKLGPGGGAHGPIDDPVNMGMALVVPAYSIRKVIDAYFEAQGATGNSE